MSPLRFVALVAGQWFGGDELALMALRHPRRVLAVVLAQVVVVGALVAWLLLTFAPRST